MLDTLPTFAARLDELVVVCGFLSRWGSAVGGCGGRAARGVCRGFINSDLEKHSINRVTYVFSPKIAKYLIKLGFFSPRIDADLPGVARVRPTAAMIGFLSSCEPAMTGFV